MHEDEHGFPKAPFQARAHPPRTGAAHFVGVSVLASEACEDLRSCSGCPRLEQGPVLGTYATHATHATNATLPGGRAHGVLRQGE